MSTKTYLMRYIFVFAMLCCVVTAQAQGGLTSSNIIASSSYKEEDGKLKFEGEGGATRVLSKDALDAKIVVDKRKNQISIDLVGQKTIIQSLEQDVVVINLDGVSILTKSVAEPLYSVERVYAAETEAATGVGSEVESAESKTIKSKTSSRVVEMAASVRGGFLFYDDPITIMSASLRSTIRLKSIVRIGLSLSTDVYTFLSDDSSYNSGEQSMYMLSTAFACDLSLWDKDKPSALPARLTLDVGAGFGVSTTQTKGLTFSPGLMWYVAGAEGNAKLCLSLNYKYQSFGAGSYASGMMLGLGYKF